MQNKKLITFAQDYARKAHAHISKTTVSGITIPQIVHIQEVADLVWASGGTDDEIVAAWLHDIVEDTEINIENIEEVFGKEVAEMVAGLTDPLDFKGLPIEERKQKQVDRLLNKSNSVKRIKMADQTSNVKFLAVDPSVSWANDRAIGYVEGAKKIVTACSGVSKLLEDLFESVYIKAIEKYNA
jgi:guanosine-3',5'-bis(diphosphate) 3'-pyrophosphohydrolase